ncbi:MAG: Stp1/IreP family PP2C-type Ser/Thr phosphatase [Bacilli bacterium]|nr:Stp1/IreP family PP2C-type Ser/Thr phosphatase [Bacilli bacterium]
MVAYYQTDPGKVRSHNEDSVNIVENVKGERLVVVADGMGGHKAGEVASSLVVNELSRRFSELSSIGTKEEAVIWLKEIIDEINIKILKYAEEHIDASGLGTTCVCSIITDEFLLFGNIGDSSGFVYKKGKLYKVTKDHTLVNILLENGELSESAAKVHPQKNVLMKALGAAEKIEMDIFDVERDVDGVFLCSDGLTNMMTPEQIEKILNDGDLDLEDQVGKMIMKANMRGGTDNITVACIRFGGE